MVYLFLDNNTIQLLSLSKTLLGQYNISFFNKTHSSELIKDGAFTNIDLVASAIKEALTAAQPQAVTDKSIFLVLPQEAFSFGRYTIPSDMSEAAIDPFIKDKVRTDLNININATHYDYIVSNEGNESTVAYYGISFEAVQQIEEVLQLLQLDVNSILPDTLAYYTLFAKTLRKEKMERILYAKYNEAQSFGYLFDSLGLLDKDRFIFGTDIKVGLKKKVVELAKKDIKLNRIILSGTESRSVRQDLFTKEVGAWTNPLEKIIDNFYQEYLKLIVPEEGGPFSVLKLDTAFGAFIFDRLNSNFSIYSSRQRARGSSGPRQSSSSGRGSVRKIFSLKTLGIFVVSFLLSFGVIFGISQLDGDALKLDSLFSGLNQKKEEEKVAKVIKPTAQPKPTPSLAREDIKVKILNGSGIVGKANEIKELLTEQGYSDIVTGNADSFDIETSEIQVKDDKEDAFTLLQEDLSELVKVEEASTLDEDEAADIVFIIGKDIEGESAEPTEEPAEEE